MHLGDYKALNTLESYAPFILSNLWHASITRSIVYGVALILTFVNLCTIFAF